MRFTRTLIGMAALACSALAVAACGASTPAASPATTPSPTAAATASATASATTQPSPTGGTTVAPTAGAASACATSVLHVLVPAVHGNAAAGSSYYPIQFVNASGSPCTLYGYPGVSFVTSAGGSQIGVPATRNPATSAQLITLSPGETVHAVLQVVDALNYPASDCGLVTAHWLKVYPPNQTAAAYVSFTAQTCSKAKTILSVETVQTGSTGP
jgi:hypothetical protein